MNNFSKKYVMADLTGLMPGRQVLSAWGRCIPEVVKQ
jgi:hypothetical protein